MEPFLAASAALRCPHSFGGEVRACGVSSPNLAPSTNRCE